MERHMNCHLNSCVFLSDAGIRWTQKLDFYNLHTDIYSIPCYL